MIIRSALAVCLLAGMVLPATALPAQMAKSAIVHCGSPFHLAQGCCRTCRTAKACGNSCIAADRRCHQPPGCACDG